MINQRQFFRQAMKDELKATGRRRMYKKTLRANGRKASLGNMVMLAMGMSVD